MTRAVPPTLPSFQLEADEDADGLPTLAPPRSEVTPTAQKISDFAERLEDPESDTEVGPFPVAPRLPEVGALNEEFDAEEEEATTTHSCGIPDATGTGKHKPLASWNVRFAPVQADPLCGRTMASGKYRLQSVIGTGAMGIVFKAVHLSLGRSVAIKVLHPRYRDHLASIAVFEREARAASLLEHPHVARLYDYGEEPDGLVYIVMEYLSGYTLGTVLEARRKLPPARAVSVMMQTCSALAAAHQRGIVHRDVKPDNIVLVPDHDDDGRPIEVVKVCDFGIAALASGAPLDDQRAYAAGTPEYMAPEHAIGDPATPATDVYACGVVLYEMLAGRLPFSGDEPRQIMMKHVREAPPPLGEGVPEALEDIVRRALAKKRPLRYRDARELRAALRAVRP
jgi:serine/threonine-protein kinase